MPGSWPYLRPQIREYLTTNFSPESTVLDIGAGEGTYQHLLGDYFDNMDAVEIWTPYISTYNLKQKYKNVFNVNIMDFEFTWYDIIIMGDTLEHLSVEDGMTLIADISTKCRELVVSVPFNLPQNGVYDPASDSFNPYEEHLQPDLNFDNFFERYPSLKFMEVNPIYNMPDNKASVRIDVGENVYYLCAFVKC